MPSGNNVAARNLNNFYNDLNKKRIHVNSQVTAMITILESAYVIVHTIVLAVVAKKSTLSTLVPRVGLFFVILPYAFLMNTCHNKNRIVDIGWENVIKNILGWKDNSSLDTSNNVKETKENKQNLPTFMGSASKNHEKQQKKIRKESGDLNQNRIFVISTLHNDITVEDIEESCTTPSSINLGASTSALLKSQTSDKTLCDSNKCKRFISHEKDISPTYNIEEISTTLIGLMLSSLQKEDVYITYLKKIIEIHDSGKKENYSQHFIDELVMQDVHCQPYYNKHKKKRTGSINQKNVIKQSGKNECLLSVQQEQAENQHPRYNTKYKSEERTSMRENLLTELSTVHNEHEQYNVLFESLIRMEEDFIE